MEPESKNLPVLPIECLSHILKFLPARDRITVERGNILMFIFFFKLTDYFSKIVKFFIIFIFILVSKKWFAAGQLSWHNINNFNTLVDNWGSSLIDDELEKLLSRCGKYISHVDFSGIDYINKIRFLSDLCRNLQSVVFTELKIDESDFRYFSTQCKNISSITLAWLPDEYDDSWIEDYVLAKFNLKYFKLRYSYKVTGSCFRKLSEKIEEIHVAACPNLQMQVVCHVRDNFSYVVFLFE